MKMVIIGPQGSGKSTQAVLLAKRIGLPHLQSGELLRRLVTQPTELGQKVKAFLIQGRLVTDELLSQILKKEINQPAYQNGFVLDGTPRTLAQARKLPFRVTKVVYLRVSDEENFKRLLLRRRQDDTPEIIAERLKIYHRKTEPVLDFYRKQGLLIEVDGERPIKVIHQDIVRKLKGMLKNKNADSD